VSGHIRGRRRRRERRSALLRELLPQNEEKRECKALSHSPLFPGGVETDLGLRNK